MVQVTEKTSLQLAEVTKDLSNENIGVQLIDIAKKNTNSALNQSMKCTLGANKNFDIEAYKSDVIGHIVDKGVLQENILIIDPSKNKMGDLTETGSWDSTGVQYKIDEVRGLHDSRNTKFLNYQYISSSEESSSRYLKLPLISPRHFGQSDNIDPFGISLRLQTDQNEPAICVSVGRQDYVSTLDLPIEHIQAFYEEHSIHLPEEVISRVADMWNEIKSNGNNQKTEKTVNQYINEINSSSLGNNG